MKPELDSLYVYDSHGAFPRLMVKGMKSFPYMQSGILHDSGMITIYRYALDVQVNGTTKTLLMVSFSNDIDKVDRFMQSAVSKIETGENYNKFVQSQLKPIALDILFT